MSKRVFMLGVAIYVVPMAFLLTDRILAGRPGVTVANCRKIRKGMTLQEVEAHFGRAANDDPPLGDSPAAELDQPSEYRFRFWQTDEVKVLVMFTRAERVVRIGWRSRRDTGFIASMRSRLGW
jgi:hypothetical protein